jgi:uncharacterized protein DUF2802
MMTIDTTYSLYALLISNAFLACAAALAIMKLKRLVDTKEAFWNSPTGAAMSSGSDHDELLRAIEMRLVPIIDAISNISQGKSDPTTLRRSLPLENAVRMARQGATLEDLTRNCGLNATEARLLMRVHAQPALTAEEN